MISHALNGVRRDTDPNHSQNTSDNVADVLAYARRSSAIEEDEPNGNTIAPAITVPSTIIPAANELPNVFIFARL